MAVKKTKKDEAPAPAPAPAGLPTPAMPGMLPVPGMMPGMVPGMQPGMVPGMQPGMVPGMQPGMVPGMQPGMVPGMQPGMIPGMQPGMVPGMQPGMVPGMQPQMNPMLMMMQMMQMMGGGMGMPVMDPAAVTFAAGAGQPDGDKGLDAAVIRPARVTERIKTQEAVPVGSVLDYLCLSEDGKFALGGIPKGCTIAFAGPPGAGKTRTSLGALAKVALGGAKVAFVVAEEGFHDSGDSGRDDLCSRMTKIGMAVTGLSEKDFAAKVLENVFVLEAQYHKGNTWDEFVGKYRYLVEKENIRFVVVDSLNMLDPTKNHTADNLSALKTYNHEKGVTCLCLGQIRDTGMPVGGEALQHTADAVFLIESMSMGSKEMAELWGSRYRETINVIRCIKSVTTPRFENPVRLGRAEGTGLLVSHPQQPAEYALPPLKG